MFNNFSHLFTRYWIALAVLTFALLSAYTSNPIYGQSAPPTPDVNTVPRPEEIITPTNTPFPTPTPIANDGLPGDNSGNGGSGNSGGGTQPQPTATPTADDSDNSDNSGNTTDNTALPGENTETTAPLPSQTSGSGTFSNDDPNAPTGVVNVVTLNVRRGPNTSVGIIDTLFLNEPVTILGRDSGGAWWNVCCGSASGLAGWVSAQFITPNFDRGEADTRLPVTAVSSAAGTSGVATAGETSPLVLEMRPSPAFVWQGQTVQLQLVLRNTSEQAYTNVRLRNDLPPTLIYLKSLVNDNGTITTAGQEKDGIIYTIKWPEVPAGGAVTATVTVRVTNEIGNGALVDNLAMVDTAEGAVALAGLTFAMPPIRLPQFR